MLGRQYHGVHPDRLAILVILHRDLGLAIGPQIAHQSLLAHIGEALGHFLGNGDSQRHQLRCLVAGIAEHHALVAGAVIKLAVVLSLRLKRFVNAESDVGGLFVNVRDYAAGVAVKAVLCSVVADLTDDVSCDLGNIDIAARADLAHDVDKPRGSRGLAGNSAVGVLLKYCVQHRIGDLVADFVGMTFGHGFGSKQVMSCHNSLLIT